MSMPSETGMNSQSWPAPAKINLFLHVLGRAPDGYHQLQTLFQVLDWGDEIKISLNDSGAITRSCNIDTIPASEDICIRAAHLLQNHCCIQNGAHIDLKKNIPLGAGLGGGSSDAATVLVALNKRWACGLSSQQLADIGLQLGADVPVFVHGRSAWAEGRGEILQPVSMGERYYVLVFPSISISTAGVFRHAGLKRDSEPMKVDDAALQPGRNDCEAAALEMYPQLKTIKRDLTAWGEAFMTGTGSTFFLPFESKKAAINAASELKCRYNIRAVDGVDRSALLDRLSSEK